MSSLEDLKAKLRQVIIQLPPNVQDYQTLLDTCEQELKALTRDGSIRFGPDYTLANQALEVRVENIFASLGFYIQRGRKGYEDFSVRATSAYADRSALTPLVIEVKSSVKSSSPSRDDLRQLDDWVFDVSGEEHQRKGRQRWVTIENSQTGEKRSIPWLGPPTRHKGVFIFNGPTMTKFDDRPAKWLGANEEELPSPVTSALFPLAVY